MALLPGDRTSMPEFDYPYDPAKFVPPPDWRLALQRPWPFWAILGGFGFCFALIDFSFCWVGSDYPSGFWDLWMGVNSGAVGAQLGLLAIYAVLGPNRNSLRLVVAITIGFGALLAWLLGYFLAHWIASRTTFPFDEARQVYAQMLVVPSLFFAGCVPLWMLRAFFRWRIERQVSGPTDSSPPQLSIAGILAATFVVAVVLALVRLGNYLSEFKESEWWLGTGIAAAFTTGICLFTLPFSTWGILRTRNLVAGAVLSIIWLCLVSFGVIAIASALVGRWPDQPLDVVVVTASFIVFLLGPLVACRCFNYRLLVGRPPLNDVGR